jgi:hypothetical protein
MPGLYKNPSEVIQDGKNRKNKTIQLNGVFQFFRTIKALDRLRKENPPVHHSIMATFRII